MCADCTVRIFAVEIERQSDGAAYRQKERTNDATIEKVSNEN